MKPLTFYIVFHKIVFEENTKDFTDSEKKEMLCWIAVNEKIPKSIPDFVEPLLYEYKMAKYNPLYQMNNFYQNSVFFHLYHNQHLIDSEYIGFSQYDISHKADPFRKIFEIIKNDASLIFPGFIYPFECLYCVLSPDEWKKSFVEPYNTFYGTSHTLENLQQLPLCLFHTFIMPTWYFKHMMEFVEHILPTTLKYLNWDTRHLAGTLERVIALSISCAILEGVIRPLPLEGCVNNINQHTGDEMRGIPKGSNAHQVSQE